MEQLLSSFKQGNVILFVGAGVSTNLGLPSWGELIDKIAQELGYDPEIYKTFGDHYALAEYYRIKKVVSVPSEAGWTEAGMLRLSISNRRKFMN